MISVFKPLVERSTLHAANFEYDPALFLFDGNSTTIPVLPFNHTIEGLNRDVYAKPLHSHNDYWRQHPLFDALSVGAVSVESDVWVFDRNYTLNRTSTASTGVNETLTFRTDEVYVGHNQEFLRPINTLFNLYLNPLFQFLQFANPTYTFVDQSGDDNGDSPLLGDASVKNSVFYNNAEQPLYLWFDFKTSPNETYDALKPLLQPFIDKGYLAYYNTTEDRYHPGPLILTITGNLPTEKVSSEEIRYFFLDGPLQNFTNDNTDTDFLERWSKLSRVASGSLLSLLGRDLYPSTTTNEFSEEQKEKLKEIFDKAHEYGLKTRIWGDIIWPWNLLNSHLEDFFQLGSDLLNVDDLQKALELFPQ
ncbi:Altered inheritance of mitochondria protein 6 [Candida viswanathii]|uniref:Altered inheritance of mitochondria protein 6 n=1 Tax=Candida viswanathii TaxID=5486 RepID=A0A367XZ80_9ASCO|nr:Altered inheritance of mitochondria protein 6 [Candida viswanathii]